MLLDVFTHHLLDDCKKIPTVKNDFLLSSKAATHSFLSHLILLLLFQRLGDPFEPLFVRKLRPLFAKTIFNVFGGRLGETQKKLKSLKAAKKLHSVFCAAKLTSGCSLRKAFFSWLYHNCWGVLGFSGTFEPFLAMLSTRSGCSSLFRRH